MSTEGKKKATATPTKKRPVRGNTKTDPSVDKLLLEHLKSKDRHKGVSCLTFKTTQEEEKAKDRLKYLRNIRRNNFKDFIDICCAHNVEYPFEVVNGIVAPSPGFDVEDETKAAKCVAFKSGNQDERSHQRSHQKTHQQSQHTQKEAPQHRRRSVY